MSYKPTYKKGDHKAICDRCGFLFKASQLFKEWTGLRVCKINDCWEPRHPQDFLRGIKDDQSVPWTRSESDDIETKICDSRSAIAGIGQASCAIVGNNSRPPGIPPGTFVASTELAWIALTSGTTSLLRSVFYHDGLWVVCGDDGVILTSANNGETWVARTSGIDASLLTVKYWDGTWYAVGYVVATDVPTILSSPDAITWSAVVIAGLPANGGFYDMALKSSSPSRMVLGGWNTTDNESLLVDTSDGATWNVQTVPAAMRWAYGIQYSAAHDNWMVVGGGSAVSSVPYLGTSADGLTWTDRESPVVDGEAEIWVVDFDGSNWVIGETFEASDGVTDYSRMWTSSETTPTSVSHWASSSAVGLADHWLWRITHNDSRLIACGGNNFYPEGVGTIITSEDSGRTWTTSYVNATDVDLITKAWFGNNYWIAVGNDGLILRSAGTS